MGEESGIRVVAPKEHGTSTKSSVQANLRWGVGVQG